LTLIVDASVALKWYLGDEPHAAEARAILDGGEDLIAPDIIIAEVCNAAWLGVRASRVGQRQAEAIARSLPGFFTVLVGGSGLAERGVAIAGQLDHPVYDCFYLALAEARDAALITADRRLLRKLRRSPWAERAVSLVDYS
jgi:predicted nucleic acid-binding protein